MTKRKAKRKATPFSNALRTIHSQHDRIIDLLTVLRECETALTDWLQTYAWDQSSEEQVEESLDRINKAGGTLAYICKLLARIREALKP